MSNYSGYSTASKLAIARIEQEKAVIEHEKVEMAAKMAAQDAQMAAQKAQLDALQAMLVANGMVSAKGPVPSTSGMAKSSFRNPAPVTTTSTQPAQHNGGTPGRKRHSSQQLGGASKDSRMLGEGIRNRFEVLTQADSYPDRSMRPGSVTSTSTPALPAKNWQNKPRTGNAWQAKKPPKPQPQPVNTVQQPSHSNKVQQRAPVAKHSNISVPNVEEDSLVEGVFDVHNVGPIRQELEVAVETLNGEKFLGTITPLEAKFNIYKEGLGFEDFSNFDGARIGFRGVPLVVFKFKTPINVDELYPIQNFQFVRKTSRQGKSFSDVIGCKIRGLRAPNPAGQTARPRAPPPLQDDGTRMVKIEGCEYRVPKSALVELMTVYGEVLSDVSEILFKDGMDPNSVEAGTNRSGIYAVQVKLNKPIPQLIPIMGKRLKIQYPGVQRLCTNCFGRHNKQNCQSRKVTWSEYTNKFKESNPDFPRELFNRPTRMINPDSHELPHEGGMQPLEDTANWVMNHSQHETPDSDLVATGSIDMDDTVPKLVEDNESNQSDTKSVQAVKTKPSTTVGPKREDFLIPANETEYNQMVERLVAGGSSVVEAELIISSRKSAFNKANREYKRGPGKQTKQSQKKETRQSKHVEKDHDDYGA